MTKKRLFILPLCFFLVLLLYLFLLFRLQIVEGEAYLAQSERNLVSTELVPAARGDVVDRNGVLLLGSRVSYSLFPETSQMGDDEIPVLLALMALCAEEGVPWTDSLPISETAPYRLEEDASLGLFKDYLALWDLSLTDSPTALLAALAEQYALPEQLTETETRRLVGFYYEEDLRREGFVNHAYVFAEDVSVDFIARIKERSLPGVRIEAMSERSYGTEAAPHLLGRTGAMNESEWAEFSQMGYAMNEDVGKDGVEEAFEDILHGEPGLLLREYDRQGKVLAEHYEETPRPGDELMLTLDLDFQEAALAILEEELPKFPYAKGASLVALSVDDFGVLGMISYPDYTLSQFSEAYPSLLEDPENPLLNRAIQGTYAPGSAYKMVTALAGLEEGVITPETQIMDTGVYTYYPSPQPQCWFYREEGMTHGLQTLSEALENSCNVFFYDLGRRLGIEAINDYAEAFGFGELTGIELSGEAAGVIASPQYTASLEQTWYEGNVLSAAIGQENNRFTPLQLASYVATVANGGRRYAVHVEEAVRSYDGSDVLHTYEPRLLEEVPIAPDSLTALHEGMLGVTQSGELGLEFAPLREQLGISVAAKTGSAQVGGSEAANSIFVCFAPYDAPEIALALVVEEGDGGTAIGYLAARILEAYFGGLPTEVPDTAPKETPADEASGTAEALEAAPSAPF